jgi:hypothetical protein
MFVLQFGVEFPGFNERFVHGFDFSFVDLEFLLVEEVDFVLPVLFAGQEVGVEKAVEDGLEVWLLYGAVEVVEDV